MIKKLFSKKQDNSKVVKSTEESISQGEVLIKVYMRFGAEIRQKRAEYTAIETRDGYSNLVAISRDEKWRHNEDVNFIQQEIYRAMNITLGISGKSKDEAIDVIKKELARVNRRIVALEKYPELNKFANIWDEKRKANELSIHLEYIQFRSPNGAYFKIENGKRVYEYESVTGFLIPIWHGATNLIDYPDFEVEKKITMQETAEIVSYFESKGKTKVMISVLAMLSIITTVLILANMFGAYKLYQKSAGLDQEVNDIMLQCSQQTLRTAEAFNEVMRNPFIKEEIQKMETQQNKSIINKIIPLTPNK